MTKRALVIEGGGFRASYGAGALYQLLCERPDLHFDVVAANSSSVCSAAYFVTKQKESFEKIWIESDWLGSPKLLSWWRAPISWRKSFLNIDYLFDDVFKFRAPLDLEALQKSPTDFFVTVMEFPKGGRSQFSNRDPEIYDAMRASCAVPWAYIGKINIRGRRYIDGFYDSIPLRIALEQGADDIWIISTRPHGYRKGRLEIFEKPPLKFSKHCRLLAERHRYYNPTADAIESNPQYKIIRPQGLLPISRLTRDLVVMKKVFQMGQHDMKKVSDTC